MRKPYRPHAWSGQPRRGSAVVIATVAIVVVSVLSVTVTWQLLAGRRVIDHRQRQLQAEWLARAGVEVAIAHLLANSGNYRGETFELIPESELRISVEADPNERNAFVIQSDASFPRDGPNVVVRSVTRKLRRLEMGTEIRIEVSADPQTNAVPDP